MVEQWFAASQNSYIPNPLPGNTFSGLGLHRNVLCVLTDHPSMGKPDTALHSRRSWLPKLNTHSCLPVEIICFPEGLTRQQFLLFF